MGSVPLVLPLCSVALIATGCRGHHPLPLDRAGLMEAWGARSSSADALDLELESAGGARDVDLGDGIGREEARWVSLCCNPALRAARLELVEADVGVEHARSWDDPSLDLDLLRAVESAARPWLLAGALKFTIPFGDLRDAREAEAAAARSVARGHLLGVERAELAALDAAWVAWSSAELRERALRGALEELGGMLGAVDRLEAGGALRTSEARLFDIEVVHLRGRALSAAAEASSARSEVLRRMGLRPDAPFELRFELEVAPPSFERLSDETWLAGDAELSLRAAEYEAAEAELRKEIAEQWPGLGIGPGAELDGGDESVGLAVETTLPLWNRNRPAIAAAEVARDRARARYEQTLQERVATGFVRERAWRAAVEQRRFVEKELRPLVEQQLAEIRALADLGELDVLVWLETWRRVFQLRLEVLEAATEEARAAVALGWLVEPWSPRVFESGEAER